MVLFICPANLTVLRTSSTKVTFGHGEPSFHLLSLSAAQTLTTRALRPPSVRRSLLSSAPGSVLPARRRPPAPVSLLTPSDRPAAAAARPSCKSLVLRSGETSSQKKWGQSNCFTSATCKVTGVVRTPPNSLEPNAEVSPGSPCLHLLAPSPVSSPRNCFTTRAPPRLVRSPPRFPESGLSAQLTQTAASSSLPCPCRGLQPHVSLTLWPGCASKRRHAPRPRPLTLQLITQRVREGTATHARPSRGALSG